MNEPLLYILIAANTPLYVVYAVWTFGSWSSFGRSFLNTLSAFASIFSIILRVFGVTDGAEEIEDRFKFLWWVLGCVVTVAAEYYGITKIFHV